MEKVIILVCRGCKKQINCQTEQWRAIYDSGIEGGIWHYQCLKEHRNLKKERKKVLQ